MRCEYDSRVIYDTPEKRRAVLQMHRYKQHDRKSKRAFDLTLDDFLGLTKKECSYCGRQATGLDRKDSRVGHVRANCVPCCFRCNRVKGDTLSFETMLEVGKVLARLEP